MSEGEQAPESLRRRTARLLVHWGWPVDAHPDSDAVAFQHGDDVAVEAGGIGLDAAGDLSPPNFHNTLGDVLNEGGHQSRLPAGQLDVGGPPGGAYILGDEVQSGVCHLNGHSAASTVAAVTVGTSEIAGRGRPQDEITHGHDRARSL